MKESSHYFLSSSLSSAAAWPELRPAARVAAAPRREQSRPPSCGDDSPNANRETAPGKNSRCRHRGLEQGGGEAWIIKD